MTLKNIVVKGIDELKDKYLSLSVLVSMVTADIATTSIIVNRNSSSVEQNEFIRASMDAFGAFPGHIAYAALVWPVAAAVTIDCAKSFSESIESTRYKKICEQLPLYSLAATGIPAVLGNVYQLYI